MNVCAFDLSLTRTGIATPGRCYSVAPKVKGTARLAELRKAVVHAARASQADLAVIERVVPGPNAIAGQGLAGVGAIARLALWDLGVPFIEVWPVHVKQFAANDAKADKETMLGLARAALPLTPVPDHDAGDAAWLWLMGMALTRRWLVPRTGYRQIALAKVEMSDGTRRRVRLAS